MCLVGRYSQLTLKGRMVDIQDMDNEVRAITRPLKGGAGDMDVVFKYTARVTEFAFVVSMQTGIRDYKTLCSKLYHELRDPTIRSTITQSAIRDGVATANAYRTAMQNGLDPSEPTFKNPVIKLNSQSWRLNEVVGGYVAKTNIGSRTHSRLVVVNVSRSVAKHVLAHMLGELWLTPTSYVITYSERVPSVKKPVPTGKCVIAELVADVGRVNTKPKNILAVDLNVGNVTAGDDSHMVQFDMSGAVDEIVNAKTRTINKARDDLKYVRKVGRRLSYEKEEARRERQKVARGGTKLHGKLKRRCRKLKKAGKKKAAKEVKKEMARCVTSIQHSHSKRKDDKKAGVGKAVRAYEHQIHVMAICIVQWAQATDALLVLENLRGMYAGWSRQKGKFSKGMRRKLYSSGIMKISDIIYAKARLAGVEAVKMNPHNTSKLCAVCRNVLSGDYHTRHCRHCCTSVDRDVNAVENMRRTSAVARYGLKVQACPDEAYRAPDVILDSGALVHGDWSRRANGLVELTCR